MLKKLVFLALFSILYTVTHAQDAGWMTGTWSSVSRTATPSRNVTHTIRIDNVSGASFTGTKTSEMNDGSHASITVSIAGFSRGKDLYLRDGAVVQKEPGNSQWDDCSSCTQINKVIISRDSLILINSISGCNNRCDGVTFYYRLLSEYDDSTQQYLVDWFGRPADIIGFRPFRPQEEKAVASNDDNGAADEAIKQQEKRRQDSLDNIAKIRQQQIDDSTQLAQQKKRQQEMADSLNLVQQKEQQRIKDSLDNIAKIRQQQIADSNLLAQQKKRQQEMADSLNLAQQKEQQRIKDSLDNVAKIRQQQINDSTLLAQQKKRQQEMADSLNLVQQKEQQRIKDSLDNIAKIRQQQIADSTLLAQQKKRQQEIADSLNLAQQKEQQRIKDSLDNIARIRQQQIKDSTLLAQQKKQQQEIADSLNLVQQREHQRINDSLQNVAAANLQKQRAADSLAAVRKQQNNDSLQKAALAKAVPASSDSAPSATSQALTSRTSVLLGTYHITTPDILIELFDNGEIDGDRVSVFHNNAIIVSNQTLGIKPITLNIHADTANRKHEFVLVAENLGTIPPNSALMRITVGKQIYKLTVNTDLKTNARIVFYYDGN